MTDQVTHDHGDVAFHVVSGDWCITGTYDGPENIRIYHQCVPFREVTCEGYRIWNFAAHLEDYIPDLEDARTAMSASCAPAPPDAAPTGGLTDWDF